MLVNFVCTLCPLCELLSAHLRNLRNLWIKLFTAHYNYTMDSDTIQRLLALNHQFYQTFAAPFSATRQRLQPGVLRLLPGHPQRRPHPRPGLRQRRAGAPAPPARLSRAATWAWISAPGCWLRPPGTCPQSISASSRPTWPAPPGSPPASLPSTWPWPSPCCTTCPARRCASRWSAEIHRLLAPGGRFIHSNWQFLNSPRLARRIQPWDAAGLDQRPVEPGDYLLDWRQGGAAACATCTTSARKSWQSWRGSAALPCWRAFYPMGRGAGWGCIRCGRDRNLDH